MSGRFLGITARIKFLYGQEKINSVILFVHYKKMERCNWRSIQIFENIFI
jgi:hypothetical protein